jgi:predicted DNA-binding transcriptional regulator YafY
MFQNIAFKDQLIMAIRARRKVQINYKGSGWRTMCPHILFVGPSGNELIEAYQISGYSSHRWNAGPLADWRTFSIDYITDLKITNETFDTAPGYDPSNSYKYPRIIEKV